MSRRLVLRVLLALQLLVAQQLAFTHALSHWGRGSAAAAESKATRLAVGEQLCEQCLAFAHIANAVGNDVLHFALPATLAARIALPDHVGVWPRTCCAFDSRAPPIRA